MIKKQDMLIEIPIKELLDLFIDMIPLILLIQISEQYRCKSIADFTLALNKCLEGD